ncbi:DUF3750 domain-containing protein [Synechocystis sp. B12]|nr:DUF3750 domain-containing protein [Synechocystis sp. B12]
MLNSPQIYPHCYSYRYWPSLNSNTYAQWVLEQAAINFDLSRLAVGRGYGQSIFSQFSHGHRQLER